MRWDTHEFEIIQCAIQYILKLNLVQISEWNGQDDLLYRKNKNVINYDIGLVRYRKLILISKLDGN